MATTSGYWLSKNAAFSASGFTASRTSRSSGGKTYYNRYCSAAGAYQLASWTTTALSPTSVTLPLLTPQPLYTFTGSAISGGSVSCYLFAATKVTPALSVGSGGTATATDGFIVSETADGTTYSPGSTYVAPITFTATPDAGGTFVGWYKNGTLVSTSTTWTCSDYTGDFSVSCSFGAAPSPTRTVAVYVSPSEAGTVTGGGSYVDGDTATVVFTQDATQTILYPFSGWYASGVLVSSSATYSFTVDGDVSLTATCATLAYANVSFSVSSAAYGSVSTAGGQYLPGATATCTASAHAASGASFVNWTDASGSVVSTSATLSVNCTSGLVAVYRANYALSSVSITVTATEGGTASGGGSYAVGSTASLSATASSGYEFVRWSDGPCDAARTIRVTAAASFQAVFAAQTTPSAPSKGDVYPVRDLREDGSALYPHKCDVEFLVPALAFRKKLAGGDCTNDFTNVNYDWHAAADMVSAANMLHGWIVDGSLQGKSAVADAKGNWARKSFASFQSVVAPSAWLADEPTYGTSGLKTELARWASTTDFFVTHAETAYAAITDSDTGAAVGKHVRKAHLENVYRDLNGRGTNFVYGPLTVSGSAEPCPFLYDYKSSAKTCTTLVRWGDNAQSTSSETSAVLSPFYCHVGLAGSNDLETGGSPATYWQADESWTDNSTGWVRTASGFAGKFAWLKFLTVFLVTRLRSASDGTDVEDCATVPVVWSPSDCDDFLPPWSADAKQFAANVLAQLGVPGEGRTLAVQAETDGFNEYVLSVHAIQTFCFARLATGDAVENYGWKTAEQN